MTEASTTHAELEISEDQTTLVCLGDWTIEGITKLKRIISTKLKQTKLLDKIDGSGITQMDSVGALFFQDLIEGIKKQGLDVKVAGLDKRHEYLLNLVRNEAPKIRKPVTTRERPNFLFVVGRWSVTKYNHMLAFLGFVGELSSVVLRSLLNPKRIQWRSIASAVEVTGYQALPIVALMSFLIGIVLAYQLAEQLRTYGANIFIVDVTGIAVLREFGPLITAIIVAGRTSTSFAALLGIMKVNEEIDALKTMGLSPLERLVVPRIVGLLIALPLLTIWADVFGIIGSMIMSKNMLDISFLSYLERFEYVVGVKHLILGLIKTPFFALIIASVGCFQGFQAEMRAESVGYRTTKAAVQAIFLIIVADAAFSVLFSEFGL